MFRSHHDAPRQNNYMVPVLKKFCGGLNSASVRSRGVWDPYTRDSGDFSLDNRL